MWAYFPRIEVAAARRWVRARGPAMHRRFAINLNSCFRDLGVAAVYALAAGIVVALVAANDDRSLGPAWMLFDVGALPAGVMTLIVCEAAISTLRDG